MGDLAVGASAVRIRAGAISESESSLFNYLRRHFRSNCSPPGVSSNGAALCGLTGGLGFDSSFGWIAPHLIRWIGKD